MPIMYKEAKLDTGYRIDLFTLKARQVAEKVVIEIKTVEAFTDIYTAQVLTYLYFSKYKPDLLLNVQTPNQNCIAGH